MELNAEWHFYVFVELYTCSCSEPPLLFMAIHNNAKKDTQYPRKNDNTQNTTTKVIFFFF